MTETITKNGRKYRLVPVDEPEHKPYRLTLTKHFDFEIYPHDLPETMTWVKATEAAAALGEGWRLPTRDELMLMYERKDDIGGFKTKRGSGSDYPQWYWSSTEHREDPDFAWNADFSDGNGGWSHKDNSRLSCRLVRLVPVPAAS